MNGHDILKAVGSVDERYIEMSENFTPKRHRRIRLTRIAVGITAAAMVLAIPAGAMYTKFLHEDSVREYFAEGTAQYLEEQGLALNYTDENEHLRVTVDTLISDGDLGTMVLTIEGLDEKGLEYVTKKEFTEIYVTDKESGEKTFLSGGGSINEHQMNTEREYSLRKELQLYLLDTDKDYIITFAEEIRTPQEDPEQGYYITYDESLFDGISFETDFHRNVEVKTLCDDEGNTVKLSPIGFYSTDESVVNALRNRDNKARLLRKNSPLTEEAEISSASYSWVPGNPIAEVYFYSIVDVEKFEGIKIGDTKYLEAK